MATKRNKHLIKAAGWFIAASLLIALLMSIGGEDTTTAAEAIKTIYFYLAVLIGTLVGWFALTKIIRLIVRLREPTIEGMIAEKTGSSKRAMMPIIIGWGIFIATVYVLHEDAWKVWWGNAGLFWVSQAIFFALLMLFYEAKGVFYFLIVAAILVSFWTGARPQFEKMGVIEPKEKVEKQQKERHKRYPLARYYRLCWEDPEGKKAEPCEKGGELLIASIKEYNDAIFTFTVAWKEDGEVKDRALFHWDKIANPKFGTWHQMGSKRKEEGKWALKRAGRKFIGWHTGKDGKYYPMTLVPYP